MTYPARQIAVLDACVLYPAPIRDFLLHLADLRLYTPKWTDEIQEEWTRNLLIKRQDLRRVQLQAVITAMNNAFPDASISDYNSFLKNITLPDQDDAHVLAAAIKGGANVIVTANLKDFPGEYLSQFRITARHPDYFISRLIESNPDSALLAFQNQVRNLRNPPIDAHALLGILEKVRLVSTVVLLRRLMSQ